jgi:probable rRNA maturation factor
MWEIDFVLVDRATICRVHEEFLGDPCETDVITFPDETRGEIVICPIVAREQAGNRRDEVEREVLLYALHGVLHLAGYDDTTPAAARTMERAQRRLLVRVVDEGGK